MQPKLLRTIRNTQITSVDLKAESAYGEKQQSIVIEKYGKLVSRKYHLLPPQSKNLKSHCGNETVPQTKIRSQFYWVPRNHCCQGTTMCICCRWQQIIYIDKPRLILHPSSHTLIPHHDFILSHHIFSHDKLSHTRTYPSELIAVVCARACVCPTCLKHAFRQEHWWTPGYTLKPEQMGQLGRRTYHHSRRKLLQ